MYHSVTFGEKNSWDDWHLIPSSRPVISPPTVKTYQVEIPGGYGVLDLTEALTGSPMYGNRTGSLEFLVDNGHDTWINIYTEILEYLHGQHLKMYLEDDPMYYYEGRFSVNEWKSDEHNSSITIEYDLYPFKRSMQGTDGEWLWDPFSFETGVIGALTNVPVNGTTVVTLPGSNMDTYPTVIATIASGSSLSFTDGNGVVGVLTEGANPLIHVIIGKDGATLTFTGYGAVTINYRKGSL